MTFEENDCIHNIDFGDARIVDIVEETVEKEELGEVAVTAGTRTAPQVAAPPREPRGE